MTHVTDNAMFSKAQHGFRPGRSCLTQHNKFVMFFGRNNEMGG